MEKEAQSFFEDEKNRLQRSIRNIEQTLEMREYEGVDEEQIAGMRDMCDNEKQQLSFLEFLEERTTSLQEVLDACRIYVNIAQERHQDVNYGDETQQAWFQTLQAKHYLTYLIDKIHLQDGTFTPPETEAAPQMAKRKGNVPNNPMG